MIVDVIQKTVVFAHFSLLTIIYVYFTSLLTVTKQNRDLLLVFPPFHAASSFHSLE